MKTKERFDYVLRYQIDPEFHASDRIAELIDFCKKAKVAEVMMFIMPEELNTGHPTINEVMPYVAMLKQLKSFLDKDNIRLSLNPWTTINHASRGRQFKPGQNFTHMLGENGAVSDTCVCPLCRNWQEYLCEMYSYLTKEVQPVAIWIEDDFRLHNHDSESLGWGGCFCDLHLQRFSEKINRPVTRNEILEAVLAPGQPHPWRKLWMDLSRESLLIPAKKIRDAVNKANSSTRVGLMSSLPDEHSIEGRDWHALQDAIGRSPAFLTRPTMSPYTEEVALFVPPFCSRHTLASLSGPLEIYPELENCPRTGPYAKSGAGNIWQCLHAATFGSDGISINHFDVMGNGTSLDPKYWEYLAKAKPQLDSLVKLGIDDRNSQGVKVLFNSQVAASRHCITTNSFAELKNSSYLWSHMFFVLGIAHKYCSEIKNDGTPYAVNDQTLRAFDDHEIEALLRCPVLLDACSVNILVERGFGPLIGITRSQWSSPDKSSFSYESILENDASIFGLANPRMTIQRCFNRMLDMTATQDAQIKSWIQTPTHKNSFPGTVSYKNSVGGHIISLSHPLNGPYMYDCKAFCSAFRRIMLQRILFEIAPTADLAMAEDHPMHVYRNKLSMGTLFVALNAINDYANCVTFRMPRNQVDTEKLEHLRPNGCWKKANVTLRSLSTTDLITVHQNVAPLEGLFLLNRKN